MALKYWFEFTDVKNIVHRCEIYNEDFIGDSTQIYGSCSLRYSATDDILESVRGCGLRIELQANSDLNFNDLYSEEDRTFSVKYIRDNETLFNGWLNPEGLYEDLVADIWFISLDCVDGIGFLSNLSYVDNDTGIPFSGKQSLLEIVVNCLKRTLTPQNILINCDIYYDGLTETLSTFDNVYYNADRFIKDDGDTIMDCDEVLRSVLEPFGCVISNYKGQWVIYKPNTLADDSELTFFTYDSDGVALSDTTIDFSLNVGSQINDFYPHHAGGNQQKTIKSSIGAYRINYKYGFSNAITNNPTFDNNGTVIDNWTINDATGIVLTTPNTLELTPIATTPILKLTSDNNTVEAGQLVGFSITSEMTDEIELSLTPDPEPRYDIEINYKVKITASTDYYLKQSYANGTEWSDTDDILLNVRYGGGYDLDEVKTFNLELPPIPIDGSIFIEIHSIEIIHDNTVLDYGKIRLINTLLKVGEDNNGIEGENHTFQRSLKPSTKIENKKEVFNGDLKSDIYNGAIYKTNETDLTETWKRKGVTEAKPLLRIMGEERMKMYATPLQVFQGTFFGYFDYLALLNINNITGAFLPIEYIYNCKDNTIEVKLLESKNSDILDDINYLITYDYGNVVEPTIK